MQTDLGQLIAEVKENILFLQELGVTGIDADLAGLGTPIAVPKSVPQQPITMSSLQRALPPENFASAVASNTGNKPQEKTPARSMRDTLEAAKLSRFSAPKDPGAQPRTVTKTSKPSEMEKEKQMAESMFGDITPSIQLAPTVETIDDVRRSIEGCKMCRLWEGRTQIVNSTGNLKAKLMFIGEAPGADEDAQGKPFVGRAGQLLTKIIEAMGWNRDEVFIGNINRCRPPGNRQPAANEASTCKPFLLREIAIVRPEVIVVLGATAMQNLLETKTAIGKLRGNFQDYYGIKVMPTFHPAYLLRDPHKKREVWEDMKKVKAVLDNL